MDVSTIIPAYNEESTIAGVIEAVKSSKLVDEIIVVSDGSTDKTAQVAQKNGVKVIELLPNLGKGAAIKSGIEKSSGDIILFLDADLIGLNTTHIEDLINPVQKNEVDMTIGVFNSGRFSTDMAHRISPYLSGQRAVRKEVLKDISNIEKMGYGVEIALTIHVEKNNIRVRKVELKDLTHVMKEQKLGFVRGFRERIKMYWQIYKGIRLAKR